MIAGWVVTPTIISFVQLAISTPVEYFPINSQLPPVARVSQPFSFIFSPLTFSSPFPMSYSLVDPPAWLSIDSKARRIYGTPSGQDVSPDRVVGIPIELVAEDKLGAIAMNSTLVVSRDVPPAIEIPLLVQISTFGPNSGPSSLLMHPSEGFFFSFDADTFREAGGTGLSYYAVSGNSAPLPSWLQFDPRNLSFSGVTPPVESLIQPPQVFDVQLIASDVLGFAAVSIPFSIVIGTHELTADTSFVILDATQGAPFQYNDLQNILKIDEKPLNSSDVEHIAANGLPDWLEFNPQTWELSGIPELTANTSNFTLAITDRFLDSLDVNFTINVNMEIFRSDLPFLNVSAGDQISLDIKPFLWTPSDVDLNIDNPGAPWIRYDPSIFIISGTVPESSPISTFEVRLNAKSKSTKKTEFRNLTVRIVSGVTISSSTTTSLSTATPTFFPPTNPRTPDSAFNETLLWILLPVLLTLVGLLILLFICLRRRRRRPDTKHTIEISAPIPGSFVQHDTGSLEEGKIHGIFEVRPLAITKTSRDGRYPGLTSSKVRGSRTSSMLTLRSMLAPPSINLHSGNVRLYGDPAVRETRESWLAGQATQTTQAPFPRTQTIDEISFLSGTSISEDDSHIHAATPALVITAAKNEYFRQTPELGIPVVPEPFSYQNTPEFAYMTGSNNSHSSDDKLNPDLPTIPGAVYSRPQTGLGIDNASESSLRAASRRVSYAWRGGTASRLLDEYKRRSNLSTSTVQTAHTSILIPRVAENTTTENMISQPTIMHIPSRPGDVRQISRRLDETSPLFGGGSIMKSPRNFSMRSKNSPTSPLEELSRPPLISEDPTTSRDSDTSRDSLARDSPGISYEGISSNERESWKSFITAWKSQSSIGPTLQADTMWNARPTKDITASNQWLKSKRGSLLIPTFSKAPQVPAITPVATPTTPKGKGKDRAKARRPSKHSSTPSNSAASTTNESVQTSREERLRISRLREQQVLNDFKAMMSRPDEWPQPKRPLPETPTRAPLAARPNESSGLGTQRKVSRRSNKTSRSGYTDMDDAWEDIRPKSTPGRDSSGSSTGSFHVFL
ncbi:hypothetical protein BJ170DRAFT_214109 [Xylariales sp. AK1849]|nr:hypothetical protein BJ170DRAFT_214109 [Xylariales sp. AK1849]